MRPNAPERTKVFISYSHKDEEWLDRLRVHLKPVERLHGIDVWHDKKISPGMSWHDEIRQALASAKVAVLLVTADFLASEFIDREEIPALLEAARSEGAVILPVIVNHSRFADIDSLSRYQAANDLNRPLAGLSKADSDKVLAEVSRIVEQILTGETPPAASPEADATEPDDVEEAPATLAQALADDLRALLEDEQVEGIVLFEDGDDPLDLMLLSLTEDGELACEVASNDELPDEMQLSPRALRRLAEEFDFNAPTEPGGAHWQVLPVDEVDLEALATALLRVLEGVYDVSEERIAWRALPD